jgi:signal peptidase I
MNRLDDLPETLSPPVPVTAQRGQRAASRRRAKRLGNLLFGVVFVTVAIGWFTYFRPVGLGGPADYVIVQGVSMNPTYHTGDLVLTHRRASYRVGEIVAYRIPEGEPAAGLTVIHRIVRGSASRGFITRGDNNPHVDEWRPKLADIEGSPWIMVPNGGRVLTFLHAPVPLAAIAAGIAAGWVFYHGEIPIRRRRRRATKA